MSNNIKKAMKSRPVKQEEHPMIIDLKKQVAARKSELLGLLDYWYYLQNILQPHLQFLYETFFGDLEYEIENKSILATELERKAVLLSIKLRQGEKLTDNTIKFVNHIVSKESEWNSKFRNMRINNTCSNYSNGSKNTYRKGDYCSESKQNGLKSSFNTSTVTQEKNNQQEIPFYYRSIVKQLHPDIAGETEDFKNYWDNIQDAYKSSNLNRLQMFYIALCKDDKQDLDDINQELCLKEQINELEKTIMLEKINIQDLSNREPFVLEDKLNDDFWITRHKLKLRERLFQINHQIQSQERLIRSITGRNIFATELPKARNANTQFSKANNI